MCKENSEDISKMFLDKYQVDYKDPTNIYVQKKYRWLKIGRMVDVYIDIKIVYVI
jgi:hypothetical protein